MSGRQTCPITIIVVEPTNKSPVRAIHVQAVVTKRRDKDNYYMINYGKYHLRLTLRDDGSGFEARVVEERLALLVFPETSPN